MRLIDADYVLHKMDTTNLQPRTETERYAFGFAKEILRNAPTIEAEPVKQWISVEDRLPDYDKVVLVVNDDGIMHTAIRKKSSIAFNNWQIKIGVYDSDIWDDYEQGIITHWQPLPEPPERSDENAER